jgi:putative NADPH-quinone reductase
MNITIIQGHPDSRARHLCHALADAYADGAREAGHAIRRIELGALHFPLLESKDAFERGRVPVELEQAQADFEWASHIVLVYPLWLGEMPALVKAFFEQLLRPGFAFEIRRNGWAPKLKGKTARLIVTMGMPAAVYRWYFAAHSLKSLSRNILSFVGIRPVRATLMGLVESASERRRRGWLATMRKLGTRAR